MDNKKQGFFVVRAAAAIVILIAGIFFAFSKMALDTEYDFIKSFDAVGPVGFQQGDTLEQKLVVTTGQMHRLGICVVDQTGECTGKIDLVIMDDENGLVWQQAIDIAALQLRSITWLDVQQTVGMQGMYTLRIKSDEMTGILYIGSVEPEHSSDTAIGNAVKNGEELSAPVVVEMVFRTQLDARLRIILVVWAFAAAVYLLAFEHLFLNSKRAVITLALTVDMLLVSIYFRAGFEFQESLNYAMFAGLTAAFLVVAVIYVFLLSRNVEKAELYFVVSTLVFGMIYSVVLPPYSMPDEEYHFAQAYRLSNAMMGQPVNDADGYIYMRECDINYRELCPNNEYTIDMIKALIRGNKERSEMMAPSECQRTASVPVTMYVPQAVGITLGRLLHVNYARLIFMARMMNLFVFLIIVYWAIREIPYGKWIFFAICQIPMLLETVSSCSYDTPVLSLAFLFAAYLLKLCVQPERVGRRQLYVLAAIVFLFAPLKPVYAPLTALVFLLPGGKISDDKRKNQVCKFMLFAAAMVSLILVYQFSVGMMSEVKSNTVYAVDETVQDQGGTMVLREVYQIDNNMPYMWPDLKYMIENPFHLTESLMQSFVVYADEYWMALFGCGLGHLWDWHNPAYTGILMLILLYISYRKDNGQGAAIADFKGRFWILLMVAGSFFGVFLAMYLSYSVPQGKIVAGVQGRYMLPLLVVLPFFLRIGQNVDRRTRTGVVMLSLTAQILAILNIAMQVWNY